MPTSLTDLATGTLFTAVGLGVIWLARDLEIGTLRAMGPGFMPTALGWLMAAVGAMIAGRALWNLARLGSRASPAEPDEPSRLSVRSILLPFLAILAFALLITRAGLVIAIVVTVIVARLAVENRPSLMTLALAVGTAAAASFIFVQILGLPFRMWP